MYFARTCTHANNLTDVRTSWISSGLHLHCACDVERNIEKHTQQFFITISNHSTTHPPSHPHTQPPTHPLSHPHTQPPTHLPSHPHTQPPTHPGTHTHTHTPTHPHTHTPSHQTHTLTNTHPVTLLPLVLSFILMAFLISV